MAEDNTSPSNPPEAAGRDLRAGIPIRDLSDRRIVTGRVGDDDVILLRAEGELFAVSAACTHYSGPLAEGLVVGGTIRCPWHHACFSLRTGEAVRAPAFDALGCWRVEQVGDMAFVREKLEAPGATAASAAGASPTSPEPCTSAGQTAPPESIVIIGGGAAGLAAADMLRRAGYDGPLTMVSADTDAPCDRPNLSKDYLQGTAEEAWIPLRPASYYAERRIELLLGARATSIDPGGRAVQIEDGRRLPYGALLLATGAEPVRLDVPGAEPSRIHPLRSFADSRAIVAKATSARRAVVVGASFIGLEVAAALRGRGIEVHVVGREAVPLARVLGDDVGGAVRTLHESRGVVFHLGATLGRVAGDTAILSDGTKLDADLIVMGVGVRPALALAEEAGLVLDRGVLVDAYLQTSAPGVYAAGDITRWLDPRSGERIRVEHWVVAERQGQVAARNMLGQRVPFDAVPFFWSQHYDVQINYSGHAEGWDDVVVDGSIEKFECVVSYRRGGKVLAVATIGRDITSLEAERAMETA